MRTTLDIDEKLLNSVVSATGEKTKSRAVNEALEEFMRRKRVQELIDSWGEFVIDDYSQDDLRLDQERQDLLDSLAQSAD